MLADAPLVAFVPTIDLARSQAFYVGVLGLRLVEATPLAAVLDAGGTTLRLTPVEGATPRPGTTVGWLVEDIAATAGALDAAGVSFQRYPGMDQNDLGVWTSPSGDAVAWFADPDGNTLSITQPAG